ncbi:MAG TPA: zinc-binding alcohol dehydrogenase family protein [Planctomycetota bacterium]|nr:zinc-binding alcohol dehydrogenase family protein [Planctomycetota bacterium]
MKAIRLEKPGHYAQVQIDEPPKPVAGEALVRVLRVGICGTDVSGFLGKMPFYTYPRIPGHELGVEVLETGPGVTHVQPGQRCAVEPYLNCETCRACRAGRGNCCEHLKVLGVMTDGGLRPRFVLPARKLHPSGDLPPEALPLVETLGIGYHAVERGAPRKGEDVLVVGAGPIGLAAMQFAKVRGARLTVLDVNPRRLEFAKQEMAVDATVVVDGQEKEKLDGAFPVVIDATGHAGSMSQAVHFVAPTGRLVFVGITPDNVSFPDPLFHRREMTIYASRNSLPPDFDAIVKLMQEGKINTKPWVTHRTTFDQYISYFPEATKPEAGMIKLMVEIPE